MHKHSDFDLVVWLRKKHNYTHTVVFGWFKTKLWREKSIG